MSSLLLRRLAWRAASWIPLAVAAALVTGCVKAPPVYRIGILIGADTMSGMVESFEGRMTEMGYVAGRNISYDTQKSNADPAGDKRIAARFAAEKVDLVFAFPGPTVGAVKAELQGTRIPIVFANSIVEGTGLVDSVRSPGGTITGVRNPGTELTLKSFESVVQLVPRPARIMVIYDPSYPTTPAALERLRAEAASLHAALQEVPVTRVQDTRAVLAGLEESGDARMSAILLLQDSIPRSTETVEVILQFADAHRVPIAGGPEALVRSGGIVLSVAADAAEMGGLAASLADQVLKGTPAGTISVVSPQPHLYINYRKAVALGLAVPDGLLKQAVEVIR